MGFALKDMLKMQRKKNSINIASSAEVNSWIFLFVSNKSLISINFL